jgi:cytochrome c oxidase subunit 3
MEAQAVEVQEHYDKEIPKLGMWLFIFTELLFFGGLFLVYAVYRYQNPKAFHLAAEELDVAIGTLNTIILLISSMTVAMSVTAIQKKQRKVAFGLVLATTALGVVFLINKVLEWGSKFEHGLYPGSETLQSLGHGDTLFYGLYFAMTGLHALHIVIGIVLFVILLVKLYNRRINEERYALLENSGLYWHLVDIIWIFLFPLFYLVT